MTNKLTYLEMAISAIKALKQRNGCSTQAIKKYIIANYSNRTFAQCYLKKVLHKGLENEVLKR